MDTINIFKGSRKYIHGTTIFDSVYSSYKAKHKSLSQYHFDLKLISPALRPLKVIQNRELTKNEIKARMIVSHDSLKKTFYFVEADQECEFERVVYDEDSIISNFELTNDGIGIIPSSEYSLIEVIVSLNKKLLNMIFGNSSWYFVKLSLHSIPDSIDYIELHNVGNKSVITKTNILINGMNAGNLNFSIR